MITNPRFDKLAEVFGAKGFYIEKADQISDAINEAIKSGMPSIIEIPVQEYFPPAAPTGL